MYLAVAANAAGTPRGARAATRGTNGPLCPVTYLVTEQKPEPNLGRWVTTSLMRTITFLSQEFAIRTQTEPERCSELSEGLRLPLGAPYKVSGQEARLQYSSGHRNLNP